MKKILILDAQKQLSIGESMHKAFLSLGQNSHFVDLEHLPKKPFYSLRRSITKKINRRKHKNAYFGNYPKLDERAAKNIFESVKPNVVIIIRFYCNHFSQEFLLDMRKIFGFKLILIDTDIGFKLTDFQDFNPFFTYELSVYDKILSYSKTVAQLMREKGFVKSSYFPYGAPTTPFYHSDKTTDILFVGKASFRRMYLLEKIKNSNLKVFGTDWGKANHLLSDDLKSKITLSSIFGDPLYHEIQQSKIVLNLVVNTWLILETGVNLRVFEALANRAFLLTDYCEELNDLFEIGKEIETFRDSHELIDKVNYYLKNESQREKIAQKGYEKFIQKFTWEKRAQELLNLLEKSE